VTGSVVEINRSSLLRQRRSVWVTKLVASPFAATRAVRPMR
jgi:hypothetical protein